LATDIAGCFDRDYAWHDLAQVWPTPGAGEAAVSQMTQMPAAGRKARFVSLGSRGVNRELKAWSRRAPTGSSSTAGSSLVYPDFTQEPVGPSPERDPASGLRKIAQ
jgi:hypothetical protein